MLSHYAQTRLKVLVTKPKASDTPNTGLSTPISAYPPFISLYSVGITFPHPCRLGRGRALYLFSRCFVFLVSDTLVGVFSCKPTCSCTSQLQSRVSLPVLPFTSFYSSGLLLYPLPLLSPHPC
ncbi:hypothetical protein PILCRDRAFT_328506 [Piloderma croceum F 1598]|uniref:Uncharacterized protein n=1 Tax=Piloderma croceum (strain F 1598) TaxID=765440 RepID=A0A0C3FPC2_PILCF|nr:hypothetical protein PILCRDRAFT_328506 [Piloderma croceum F 1598]